IQFLTIRHGLRRDLAHHHVKLCYLGQVEHPYHARDITANRFEITLRALDEGEVAPATRVLDEIRSYGIPNYFDDQRFGSVSRANEFVARCLIRGEYEQALRLALATPYEHDPSPQKREKEILLAGWGDWVSCKAVLPRGHARSLVDYLVHHPSD